MVEGLPTIKFSNATCKGCVVGKHGRIDLEDRYFNNVLFVLDISTKLISLYKMKQNGTNKRVTFTQNDV